MLQTTRVRVKGWAGLYHFVIMLLAELDCCCQPRPWQVEFRWEVECLDGSLITRVRVKGLLRFMIQDNKIYFIIRNNLLLKFIAFFNPISYGGGCMYSAPPPKKMKVSSTAFLKKNTYFKGLSWFLSRFFLSKNMFAHICSKPILWGLKFFHRLSYLVGSQGTFDPIVNRVNGPPELSSDEVGLTQQIAI